MLLLIVVIMTLLLLETTPVVVHLLHLHEEAALAACGRSNLHTTILLVQITLLLVQKLRRWRERRPPAPQPLAHAQTPLITAHGVVTKKEVKKDRERARDSHASSPVAAKAGLSLTLEISSSRRR
jgi:hypothetical protein